MANGNIKLQLDIHYSVINLFIIKLPDVPLVYPINVFQTITILLWLS